MDIEELRKKIISCDFNFESKVSEISKFIHGDIQDKIATIDKNINQNAKNIRHNAAKQNLFENRVESLLKSPPTEAPVKRADLDQEKLKYLDKRMSSVTKEFEVLNESVKTRINEIFLDLNK